MAFVAVDVAFILHKLGKLCSSKEQKPLGMVVWNIFCHAYHFWFGGRCT